MNINNNDLRILYQSNIKDNVPNSRSDCPSPREILQFFRSEQSGHNHIKIIDHITKCYYCTQDFGIILDTLRFERKMNHLVQKCFVVRREKSKKKFYPYRLLPSYFSWKSTVVISALIIFFALSTFLIISLKFKRYPFRSLNQNQIKIIAPIKKISPKNLVAFRWESIEHSEYYKIEIFDETLYPIWISNKIYVNNATFPLEIAPLLKKNRVIYWMVIAFYSNGTKKESSLQEFSVKELLK
jgi:hypothetical protein